MAGNARRTRVRGVRGHVWAPQTKVRRPDRLARYVARRSRAPYLRRWALLIALARRVQPRQATNDVVVGDLGSQPGGFDVDEGPVEWKVGSPEHSTRVLEV